MQQENGGHSLHAFINQSELVLTLHVKGSIHVNGDLVGVRLESHDFSEEPKNVLALKFVPDNYDPKGKAVIEIKPFEKIVTSISQYSKVVIHSKQGKVELSIKVTKHGEQGFGGGSPAPRG